MEITKHTNILISISVYEKHVGIREYNTTVFIEKAVTYYAQKDRKYAKKRMEELAMDTYDMEGSYGG